jgi:hypothetical protein
MRPDGGGGGVVLIDPDSLRRAASRLKGIAGELNSVSPGDGALPAMPPGVLAVVQQALAAAADTVGPMPPDLEATVVELTRRAFWAEYADAMASGYVLSGPAAQEFYNYLRDGTLMQYATTDDAMAAGKELALLSNGFRNDQTKLFLMAASLKGVEGSTKGENLNAFCGAFINQFGTKNIEAVPRVIQAMEWGRAISFGGSTDPFLMRDVARNWTDQDLKTDPVRDLLAPLSLALANATFAGTVTRSFENEIADNEDTWSTATLLSTGVFQKDFLLECFKTGVVQKIADDSRLYSTMAMGELPEVDPYSLGRMYSDGHGGLPVDTKSIVMDALARNPEAAAEALRANGFSNPVVVYDRMGNQVPVTDPTSLLYQYGHFDDHGAAFGRAYLAAADQLRSVGNDQQENLLTLSVADNVANHGRDDMAPVTGALADDLARHHMADLHWSAASNNVDDPNGGALGWVDPSRDSMIHLTQPQLESVLSKVIDAGPASSTFLAAAAQYQAHEIAMGTAAAPTVTGDFSWVHRAGAFDSALMNAGDMNRLEDFRNAEEHQKLIVGFLNDVTKLVDVNPVAGIAIDHGIDAISAQLAPSADQLTAQDATAHAVIQNSLAAAIAQGYADHGHIDLTTAKQYGLVHDGKLDNYGSLDPIEKARYEEWLGNDSSVNRRLHEALQDAWRP